MMRMHSRLIVALSIGVVAAVAAGASMVAVAGSDSEPEERTIVRGQAYPRWPAESAVDWVGFADEFSIVTVLAERRLPQPDEDRTRGEGYVGREITARVESTIWRRPGVSPAPVVVKLIVDGWWMHDHALLPFATEDARRLSVGDRVLMALLRTSDGSWSQLSPNSTVLIEDSGGGTRADEPGAAPELRGKPITDITELLARTSPSPAASALKAADPDVRAAAVWQEQTGAPGAP